MEPDTCQSCTAMKQEATEKSCNKKIPLGYKEKVLGMRVIIYRNNLPKVALESPSWRSTEVIWIWPWTARSDNSRPCFERQVGLEDPQRSLQTELSCVFMIPLLYSSVLFNLQNMQISGTIDPCDTFTNQLYFHVYHSFFKIVTKSFVLIVIFDSCHFVCISDTIQSVLKDAVSGLLKLSVAVPCPLKGKHH